MGRHRRGRRRQKPEDLRALSLQIHKALEGGDESVDINYVLRSKNKRGENEVVKKHIDIVSPSEEEIFAHFLDLQNKFHFYDIPPISDFEEFKSKKGPLGDIYRLYGRLDDLNRIKGIKEGELTSIKKTKAKLRGIHYEPSEPPRDLEEIERLKEELIEGGRGLKGDISFLEKSFSDRLEIIQKVSDNVEELSQSIRSLEDADSDGNAEEIKKRQRDLATKEKKVTNYKALNEDPRKELITKLKLLEDIEARKKELLKEQVDLKEKAKLQEMEGVKEKIEVVRGRLAKKSDEDKKVVKKIRAIEEYEKAQRDYRTIFWFCKIFADHIEGGNGDRDLLAYSNTDKLFTLFHQKKGAIETIKFIENFIRRRNLLDSGNVEKKIISDLCSMIGLPVDGSLISIEKWRELTDKKGVPVIERFYKADLIEQVLAIGSELSHRTPKSLGEIKRTDAVLEYERARENLEMAYVFYECKKDEKYFNEALELDRDRKESDLLPKIHLSGKDLEYPGYWLVKLPINDPRAYVLGDITGCCQTIDRDGRQCVISGLTKRNNGFYVLLKRKGDETEEDIDPIKDDGSIDYKSYKIVSEAYAWLSKDDNLVLDSWESLNPGSSNDRAAEVLLEKAAIDWTEEKDSSISRVMIGKPGVRKQELKFHANKVEVIDYIKEGEMYKDALTQSIIYESSRLKKARYELREKLLEIFGDDPGKIFMSKFISVEKTEMFLRKVEKYQDFIGSLDVTEAEHVREVLFKGKFDNISVEMLKKLFEEIDLEVFSLVFVDLKKVQVLLSEDALKAYGQWLSFDQIKGFDLWKIKVLTSDDAFKAYEESGIEFAQLKDFDGAKISAIVSEDARRAYEESGIEFAQLKDFDGAKIRAIVSEDARRAYEESGIEFAQLKDFDGMKIRAIVSEDARRAYEKWIEFDQIKDFDGAKISAIVSEDARKAYEESGIEFDQIKDFDGAKISAIVSEDARKAYEESGIEFDQLKDFDGAKISAIVSEDARKAYEESGIEFAQLKDFDGAKIRAIVSEDARRAYEKWIEFDQIKDFDVDKIKDLTSGNALKAYENNWIEFDRLKDLSGYKIKGLISDKIIEAYNNKWLTFDQIKDLDDQKYRCLTSDSALRAYKEGYIKFNRIVDIDLEKIKALASDGAVKAYDEEWLEFGKIKGFDIAKIKALISDNALKAYEYGKMTFGQVKDFDIEKIRVLTLDNAIKAYEKGVIEFDQLKDFDVRKINLLTSDYLIKSYEKDETMFDQIKDFDDLKIFLLTSIGVIKAYEKEWLGFDRIKDFDIEKIKALISDDALKAYEESGIEFDQIKDFDIEKINALTSGDARKAYEKGIEFDQIKGFNADKIKAITSNTIIEICSRGLEEFDRLKDLDTAKINELASLNIDTDIEETVRNVSHLIFKKLFHGGSRRTEERRKIEQDVRGILSEMEGLERLSYANLFSECVDEHPLIAYMVAQYLFHCEWTTASWFLRSSGIQFPEGFKSREFSGDLRHAIDEEYLAFTESELDKVQDLSDAIISHIKEPLSYSYFNPHIDIIVISDLMKRCRKPEIKSFLSEIDPKEVGQRLSGFYIRAIDAMSNPASIERVLDETIENGDLIKAFTVSEEERMRY